MRIFDAMQQVNPKEILDKIEKGDLVEYNQIIVNGYLDLSNLNLQQKTIPITNEDQRTLGISENKKVIKSIIKITNSIIKSIKCNDIIFISSIELSGTIFQEPADFSGTVFCCPTSFMQSVFFQACFQGAKFCEEAIFKCVEFKTHADFHRIVACKNFDFINARFGIEPNRFSRGVTFNGAKFFGESKFDNSIINVYADFGEARFKNAVHFNGTIFLNEASFDKAKFYKYTPFLGAKFYKAANFVGSIFVYNVTFMDALFERKVDFSNATFQGIVSFMDTRFLGESFNFRDSSFKFPKDEEAACAKAKKIFNDQGKKEEADYHFFREMDARRRQKGIRGNSGLRVLFFPFRQFSWFRGRVLVKSNCLINVIYLSHFSQQSSRLFHYAPAVWQRLVHLAIQRKLQQLRKVISIPSGEVGRVNQDKGSSVSASAMDLVMQSANHTPSPGFNPSTSSAL